MRFNVDSLNLERMRILIILIFSFCFVVCYGQESKTEFDGHKWAAPYELTIPQDWTIERFLIPISFAPQIPCKGIEDIRFTPAWAEVNSDEYWSYAFLWYLDGEITLDVKTIESNLRAYYTGLIGVNGRNIPAQKILPVETSFKEAKKEQGDIKTYIGTIKMLDYMQQKPIVLNCKVHLKSCLGENKTFVFHELSPQLFSHRIWESLDKLWLDFKCVK